jgi:hypothetical protein
MIEQEADKDWAISRYMDSMEARCRQIRPEKYTEVSKSYQKGYLAAVVDMRDFLKRMGYYRK